MIMPPSGVSGVMDDDAVIEAEIQLELENINLDDGADDVENVYNDEDELLDIQDNVDLDIPNELETYIKTIQEQTSRFEQELNECDELLEHTYVSQGGDNSALLPYDDHNLLVQLARESNLDLEQYKQKIITDIENDEDIIADELAEYLTDETLPALEQGGGEMLAITGTEGVGPDSGLQEVRLAAQIQQAVEEGVVPEDAPVCQDMLPVDRQTNGQTNSHLEIQKVLREQLDKLEQRYQEKIDRIQKDEAFRRNEEEVRQRRVTEERQWKIQEIQREEQRLAVEQELAEREIQKELVEREKEIQETIKQFEEEMAVLQRETERQKKEHEQAVEEERNRQKEKQNKSAVKIQSTFRAYRVRKEVHPLLKEKKEERRKKKEEERIKEIEVEIEQRKEEERKREEEERLKKEEEKRIKEEEKRQKELEKKQKEEEKRRLKEEEEKKKQEEKRRKEEEKRLKKEEEKRKKEEVKRRKEEEEQRKKEEKRLKEEEEKRKKEEEKKRKEEEKKLKEEEEKRIKEEKRLKEEEERKKKEEEKRLKEEEEKKKKEEEKRQEEERKKKEEEEKRTQRGKDDEGLKINANDSEAKVIDKKMQSDQSETLTETVLSKETVQNKASEVSEKSEIEAKESVDMQKETAKISVKSEERLKNGIVEDIAITASRPKTPRSVRTPRRREEHKSEKRELKATKPAENADILPEHLETLRLKFIKECKPWSKISNEPWKLKAGSSKKPLRRPSSAKKLPMLSENVILQAAKVASLQQVTTVQLSDLPGNNMSPLGHCWGLRYLSLTHCHLVVVDSLSQCRQLQYLDVQGNKIEYLDLKDLGNLQYLNTSHNRLSSIHGLDSCTNLRWLDLCHNNITKLGGLETLRRLHTLKMSHNQVISTQGIGDTPTLQWVDLAHNHLPTLDDLDKLCLLLYLDVSSNNIQQIPQLTNQVLLQELLLGDNSITDLSSLAHTWLPLLQRLNLSQNSLDTLPSLSNCLLLKELDVGSNQILDTSCIQSCVDGCVYLEKLSLEDNPVVEDISDSFYQNLRQKCPRLLGPGSLQTPHKPPPVKPGTNFETMCLTQCHVYKDVMQHFDNSLKSFQNGSKTNCDLSSLCDVYFKFCDKTFNIAVEHRYAHEYGEVTVTLPTAPTTPRSGRPSSGRHKEKFMNPKDLFENALKSSTSQTQSQNIANSANNNSNSVHLTSHASPKNLFEQALKSTGSVAENNVNFSSHGSLTNGHIGAEVKNGQMSESDRTKAATKIQAFWRGWSVRRDIEEQTKIWVAVTTNQAAWRGYHVRKVIGPQLAALRNPYRNMDPAMLEVWQKSAVKIQANWRGYILRKKLLAALEYAQYDVDGEEDEDEMMLDAEFDLDKFVDLDEGLLDTDWKPPETPDIPAHHPVLKKPPSGRPPVPTLNPGDLRPPSNPRRAWKNLDSPLSDYGRVPRPPSSVASTNLTVRSGVSKKEEKLTEEWGFKDSNTAHLMMKRAKKMKYNSEHRKKISKLDPKQRLALFRKLEEVTKPSVYSTPQRKTLPRKEYFQARQDEIERVEQEKRMEFQTRASRTFQWLHTQVGDLPVSDSVINQGLSEGPKYINESNLPGLQSGKRIQLVSSPGSLDLQSVDSVSSAGHLQKPRRLSANSSGGLTSKLPPIPNNSPPAAHVKERMSFRNPKTNQSVGWGGGRKRGNHL